MTNMANYCNNCIHKPICSIQEDFKKFIGCMQTPQHELYKQNTTNILFSVEINCKYHTKDEHANTDFM